MEEKWELLRLMSGQDYVIRGGYDYSEGNPGSNVFSIHQKLKGKVVQYFFERLDRDGFAPKGNVRINPVAVFMQYDLDADSAMIQHLKETDAEVFEANEKTSE